jgi:hypothetical protein
VSKTLRDYATLLGIDPNKVDSILQQNDYGTIGNIARGYTDYTNANDVQDAYSKQIADSEDQASTLKSQMDNMPTLATMYGQDSPYAQNLAKTLAAKDAAAGRNSQYGPRAMQLQATLADKGAQYAQQQAAMAAAYNNARAKVNDQRTAAAVALAKTKGQQLNNLFNVGNSSGLLKPLNTIANGVSNGISNAISGGVNSLGTKLGDMFGSGPDMSGTTYNAPQTSLMDRQGYDIPWDSDNSYHPALDTSLHTDGYSGSPLYAGGGSFDSQDLNPGIMNTPTQYPSVGAPTDSSNMYNQPPLSSMYDQPAAPELVDEEIPE